MRPVRVRLRGRDPAPPLFCRLPFTEVSIDEAGDVWPNCCPDWVEFPLGNLLREPWEEIWNGESARSLRQASLDGSLRHCDRGWCPHVQAALHGEPDHRVRPLGGHEALDLPEEVRRGELVMGVGPVDVGMHYEPSCNLACPTCRSGLFAVTGEQAERMQRLHAVVAAHVLTHPRAISLTGVGDPFASGFLRSFLEEFDRRRYPTIERVHLHTNAILWTPAMWARLTGLHEVEVTTDISINAARPDTYARVRRPATWDRLRENLDFIGSIPNVSSIGVSMVVSQANLDELVEFHDLGVTLAAQSPRFTFVEYKRVRRRWDHDKTTWRSMGLDHLTRTQKAVLTRELAELDRRRRAGARPEIRSNLDELADALG